MNIDKADFYYGSYLFNLLIEHKTIEKIELLGTPRSHQYLTYQTSDSNNFLFMKYLSYSKNRAWNFILTDNECDNISSFLSNHQYNNNYIILICGADALQDSYVFVLKNQDVELLLNHKKAKIVLHDNTDNTLECIIDNKTLRSKSILQ